MKSLLVAALLAIGLVAMTQSAFASADLSQDEINFLAAQELYTPVPNETPNIQAIKDLIKNLVGTGVGAIGEAGGCLWDAGRTARCFNILTKSFDQMKACLYNDARPEVCAKCESLLPQTARNIFRCDDQPAVAAPSN